MFAPLVDARGMLTFNKQVSPALVKGIKYKDLLNKPLVKDNILVGDIKNFKDSDKIIIGNKLATKI